MQPGREFRMLVARSLASLVKGGPQQARGKTNERMAASATCRSLRVPTLLLVGLLLIQCQAEAKTHHSKRQTAADSMGQSELANQRDQNNWWNIWWQQYINEAEQPTVRPLVAISYGGQTIRLPPPDLEQQRGVAQTANLVVAGDEVRRATLVSRDKQQRAARQLEALDRADQENQLERQEQRSQWASVKPTMIRVRQIGGGEQLGETSTRDAQLIASSQPEAQQQQQQQQIRRQQAGQFGIQMRANSGASGSQRQRSQAMMQQRIEDEMQNLVIEQQQQQLQNQMSDYEAELDTPLPSVGPEQQASGDADDSRQVIDSSSSSMMMPERPTGRTSSGSSTIMQPARTSAITPTTTTTMPMTTTTTERPKTSRTTSGTDRQQTAGSSEATTTTEVTPTTTTNAPITTTLRATTKTSPPSTGQTQTTTTSTRPTTTTTTATPQTTSTTRANNNVEESDLGANETPISFEPSGERATTSQPQPPATGSTGTASSSGSTPTTPSGRVELLGGRPATSVMMLKERPKLFGTSTTAMTSSTSTRPESSSSEADRGRDATSASSGAPSSPPVAITTTAKPTTRLTPSITTTTITAMTTASPITTTTAARSMAPSGAENSSESDEGEEESEDDTPRGPDGASLNTAQGANATTAAGGESGEEEEGEGDEEEEEGEQTSTPASASTSGQTATTMQPSGGSAPSGPVSQKGGAQQPMPAVMELERLPKVGPTTARPGQASTGGDQFSSSVSSPPGDETPVAPSREKLGNQFEMTTTTSAPTPTDLTTPTRGTLDNELGITMPMDPMMRMLMVMMQQQQQGATQQTGQTRAQSTNAPSTKSTSDQTQTTAASRPDSSQPDRTTASDTPSSTTSLTTTTTTSSPNTATSRKRLQPPPATRMPSSSISQMGSASSPDGAVRLDLERVQPTMSTTSSQRPPQEQVDTARQQPIQPQTNLMAANTMTNLDDESGGREPKIELINMDLYPIQRLTNQQENTSTSRKPADSSTSLLQTSSTGASGMQSPTGARQQAAEMSMAEVEPGMRLRPITSVTMQTGGATTKQTPALAQQQQPTASGGVGGRPTTPNLMMPSTKNQANTVYMIMMPAGNQSMTTATTSSLLRTSQTPSMRQMLAMIQEQRAKSTTSSESITTTERPSPVTSTASRQTPDQPGKFSPSSSSSSQPASVGTTPAMSQTMQMTTTSGQLQLSIPTTSRPRFLSQDEFIESTRKQPTTKTTTSAGSNQAENVTASSRVPDRSTSLAGELEAEQRRPTTATAATTTTTTTTRPQSSSPASSRAASQDGTTSWPTTSTATSTTTTTMTTSSAGGGQQLAKLTEKQQRQQQQQQQLPTKGKVSGAQKTSSFIPSKLRNDFESQRAASGQQANEIASNANAAKPSELIDQQRSGNNSNSMSSALRQFGGANRMSVMRNAPVAFGRPATMMMATTPGSVPTGPTKTSAKLSAAQRQAAQAAEQPRFEYGPAIAVRRPDEPLANGQMPNCTLTGKNFCVITKDYPMDEVRQAVERSFRSVRLLYEELQTVSEHQLQQGNSSEPSGPENTNSSSQAGQFACQTKVEMLRPGWARDEISKEWLVVVNTDVFPQRVRTESCAQPMAPCDFVAPFHDSHCQQRYSLHRFIAVDPQQPSRVTTVLMRFKAGCNCFLKRKL